MANESESGDWRRITYDGLVEVTGWTALAAESFDRVVDQDTGEESMMVFSPDDQLQSYLSRVFGEALGVYGKRAGFRWRSVANLSVAQPDATGNFPARWLPPQGGPDGIPLHEAYPEIFPDDQD